MAREQLVQLSPCLAAAVIQASSYQSKCIQIDEFNTLLYKYGCPRKTLRHCCCLNCVCDEGFKKSKNLKSKYKNLKYYRGKKKTFNNLILYMKEIGLTDHKEVLPASSI